MTRKVSRPYILTSVGTGALSLNIIHYLPSPPRNCEMALAFNIRRGKALIGSKNAKLAELFYGPNCSSFAC